MKLFWPYVRDAVPLVLEDGVVSLDTHYKLNLAKETELLLDQHRRAHCAVRHQGPGWPPLARLASLEVSETSVDLAKQQVTVGKIRSEKLETWAALERTASSTGSCSPASRPRPRRRKRPSRPPPNPPTRKAAKAPSKPWQVLLKDVQLRNYQVHLADRSQKEPVALDWARSTRPAELRQPQPVALHPQARHRRGQARQAAGAGEVNLAPITAKLDVSTRDIDLRVAQAYISPFIRLELRSGMLQRPQGDLKSTEPLAFTSPARPRSTSCTPWTPSRTATSSNGSRSTSMACPMCTATPVDRQGHPAATLCAS
jgi:hypothetical protein